MTLTSSLVAALTLSLGQTSEAPSVGPAQVPGETRSEAPASEASSRDLQARLSFLASDLGEGPFGTTWHAALDARSAELVPGLRAEAALSLFIRTGGSTSGLGFQDNASLFRFRFRPSTWLEDEGLALTVFPLSSTRLHLGYEHPVTWARTVYTRSNSGEPALELRATRQRWSAFAALKSAGVVNELEQEEERRLTLLAGGSFEVTPAVRLDLVGTRIDRGVSPGAAQQGVELPVTAWGLSGRALWHQGTPIGSSVDLGLYRGDPAFFERFFEPESYPEGFAASVALEGSFASQRLQGPEAATPTARNEAAHAAALSARVKWNFLRVHALAYTRSVSFIQFDAPGLPPYQAMDPDSERRSEHSLTLGADYHLAGLGLTPGLVLRATLPAAFSPVGILGGPPPPGSSRFVVLHAPNELSLLPDGEERRAVLTARATARWDLGTVAGVLGEVFFTRDPNRTTFTDDVTGTPVPTFSRSNEVGFNLLLQARL